MFKNFILFKQFCNEFGKTDEELLDIYCQLRALSKFDTDYFRHKIRHDWGNGMSIPKLAERYNTLEKVIKYAIMFGKKKTRIKGTMRELYDTDPDLYEKYLDSYVKCEGWRFCELSAN